MTEPETQQEKVEAGPMGKVLQEAHITSKPLPASSGVETIELEPNKLKEALEFLLSDSKTKLNLLLAVSGVDSADSFDSVYHLWSYENGNELVIKVRIAKGSIPEAELPMVPSIATMWPTANWHERETYDLVGIRYIGHPYLRRILNPWDWEGHPLRRDYKQPIDALNDKHPQSFR